MRVLILGASGMLGHKVFQVFRERYEAWAVVRRSSRYQSSTTSPFDRERLLELGDPTDRDSVERLLAEVQPTVVVNCIGIVKQRPLAQDPIASIAINSLFPHVLADICRTRTIRLIHISTDCVFSGIRGLYSEADVPDPIDLYGRSKLLGEVGNPHLTVRTSIIGRELEATQGVVEWFLAQQGPVVPGFRRAIFSGVPTVVLAGILASVIDNHPSLAGLFHVSAEPISKFELLSLLNEAYGKGLKIDPRDDVVLDRSLNSDRFRALTDFRAPSWSELIQALVDDVTPYDVLRQEELRT